MPINAVIREKRKALGLTQEQVAERLGVSAPAVNKWERGSTCPDVAILAPLARLLETDVNTLLCFREELTEQEILEACNEVAEKIRSDGVKTGIELAEKKMREYPKCMRLFHMLSMTMDGALVMASSDLSEQERETYRERIMTYYQYVVESAEEGSTRDGAAYLLAGRYLQKEEWEKADSLLDGIPDRGVDPRLLKADVLMKQVKTFEAGRILEGKIRGDINEIEMTLLKLMKIALEEGDEMRAASIAEIGRKSAELYELGGYYSCLIPLELAAAKKEVRKSVDGIRRLLENVDAVFEMPDGSLTYHINRYQREQGQAGAERPSDPADRAAEKQKYTKQIKAVLLRSLKEEEPFAFLRSDEEFLSLLARYER